jgi:hypothetical protein
VLSIVLLALPMWASAQSAAQHTTSKAGTANAAAPTSANAPANSTINASGFSAGLGTFNSGGVRLTAFNCLRSGTRVFCDYDVTNNQSGQIGSAAFQRWGVTLASTSGRVFSSQRALYVDQDGSTFEVAELTPNNPVRLVMEYDDVPASYNVVTLAYGASRIQSVPITQIPEGQAAGTIPVRQAITPSSAQQQAQAAAPTTASNNSNGTSATSSSAGGSKATQTSTKPKSKWQKLLDGANAATKQ